MGIGPTLLAWKARVLPLNYTRRYIFNIPKYVNLKSSRQYKLYVGLSILSTLNLKKVKKIAKKEINLYIFPFSLIFYAKKQKNILKY